MNRKMIIADIENNVYDTEYAEFIMDRCAGDRMICNGDQLLLAMEDGYIYDEFLENLCAKLGV